MARGTNTPALETRVPRVTKTASAASGTKTPLASFPGTGSGTPPSGSNRPGQLMIVLVVLALVAGAAVKRRGDHSGTTRM
ncbi:MAG TPA: hypothetical protein VFP05_02280 [Thermomicrobiales bacterium]|nr:hypothetical protein [Thermomicrobiales bacterium]